MLLCLVSSAADGILAQNGHVFHIPCQTHQTPLTAHRHLCQSAQQELPEAHHRLDDADHRFDGLLAQGIGRTTCLCVQPVGHRLRRSRRAGGWSSRASATNGLILAASQACIFFALKKLVSAIRCATVSSVCGCAASISNIGTISSLSLGACVIPLTQVKQQSGPVIFIQPVVQRGRQQLLRLAVGNNEVGHRGNSDLQQL